MCCVTSLANDCYIQAREILFFQYERDLLRIATGIASTLVDEESMLDVEEHIDKLVYRGQ
jgi:hypothetical protein